MFVQVESVDAILEGDDVPPGNSLNAGGGSGSCRHGGGQESAEYERQVTEAGHGEFVS